MDAVISQGFCVRCEKELPQGAVWCPWCGKKQIVTSAPRKRRKRANGTGTIFKLSGNRRRPWAAQKGGVYIGYYPTEKAAQEALERLVDVAPSNRYNMTFAQVYESWKAEHFRDIGEAAQSSYTIAYTVFAPLHNRKFRDLRTSDFQKILDAQEDKAVGTTAQYKHLITQMSAWAIREEIITVNYAAMCKNRGRPGQHHEPYTEEEIAAFQRDGSEAALIILMLLSTGMRIGELFNIALDDYHGDYCVGGEKTESGKERVIPIRPEGRPIFEYFAEKARAAGGTRLVDGYSGNRQADNYRNKDYKKLKQRLGIDKSPHSARATYATRAATEDLLAPSTLGKVLGHASFATTQKYYNSPSPTQLVGAVEDSIKKQP